MTFLAPIDHRMRLAAGVLTAIAIALAGCTKGSTSDSGSVTVAGNVPVAYAARSNTIDTNPLSGAPTAPGGDLVVREFSSPSAPEHNLTAAYTQGKGDVTDPDVSYDGKKIVFAMNCPASNTSTINGQPACTGHWNIWEYDMTVGGLLNGTFRRVTSTTTADDVGPTYLPAGAGFVFSSNRQAKSSQSQALGKAYVALDEYEREQVFNLHTMDINGNNVQQISFNQSHDRNPVIRPDGTVMYSRWDHVADRNRFTVFTAKPDGTNLFVLYGAHNDGNSFLHPRDMDPSGPYAGYIASDLMPLDRTQEGGALVFINVANYSEENTPANKSVPAQGGQVQPTAQQLNYGLGISQYGRVTTPYPLWDGTNRVLVSYTPCEVSNAGVTVSCATLTAAQIADLNNTQKTAAAVAADSLQNNVKASYGVYMFDPATQTFNVVASPPPGMMYTHPVALLARTEPNATQPTSVDPTLAAQGLASIEVRSVYDTDALGRMGTPVLSAADLGTGCTAAIPQTAPADPNDTRATVADVVKMKDPAQSAYACSPARFVRVFRAVAPPSSATGMRSAIGNTNFEQQQILGYAPIQPDGSFKIQIPADTPIGFQVLDSQGRGFAAHTNWVQARPGERRTCDGCHSPRRGASINSGNVVDTVPSTWLASMASAHQSGETMASTLTRLNPSLLTLSQDPVTSDNWADTTQPGVTAQASIALRYTGNANSANDLATAVPTNGIINYPDHIQPLWTRDRGANTCTTCHGSGATLDLSATIAGTGRLQSYESLTVGPPVLDPTTGQPVLQIEDGAQVVERGPSLVNTRASESDAVGNARKSRLMEIMSGQTLMSDAASQTTYPNPPATAPNHATMLNAAELRLLAEFMDLGGKYYNDPFNASSGVQQVNSLDQAAFTSTIEPILMSTCAAGCHQPVGSNQTATAGSSFVENKLVLTGNPQGDFNNVLTMISNVCQPASSYLLTQPSTVPHPASAVGQTAAVLPAGSANYNTIAAWISAGCTNP